MDGARDDRDVSRLRVPPQSVGAEQAVLGGLMLVNDRLCDVIDVLAEADFYRRDHRLIYRAIVEMAEKRQPFDAVTLGEWFESIGLAEQVAGGAYLVELASTTPSAANIVAYAKIVADKATLRRVIEFGTDAVNDGFQPDGRDSAEIVEGLQHRFVDLQPRQGGGLRKAGDSLNGWFERFSERFDRGDRMTGLPTPWQELNAVTHGLQGGKLYLFAGRPGMGKSVVGLNLALFSALRGKTTGLFSLEMSTEECHDRNIASLARVPLDWVMAPHSKADEDWLARMTPAIRNIKSAPLYIDDTAALTVRQFEARARRLHRQQQLDLLVIDHLHEFLVDPKLARFEYGHAAQVCKKLAKEWNIPVVALSQLNRAVTGRTDKRPTMSDLRASGELEQKADVIVLLHREDYYDTPEQATHLQHVVEMHIAKGRSIKAGARISLRNRFDQARLEDWEGPLPAPAMGCKTGFRRRAAAAGD